MFKKLSLTGKVIISLCFILCSAVPILGKEKKQWVERWRKTTPMNIPRAGAMAVAYQDHIYVAGGGLTKSERGTLDSVEFTKILPDGTLGPWQMTSKLNGKRVFGAGIVHNGYFYVVGGEIGLAFDDLLNSVERARILPGGGLGKWKTESSKMATPRRAPVVSVLGNRLYVSGGYNGAFLTDVESAEILSDGSIGPWRNESSDTRFRRYIHSGVSSKGRLFVFGGHLPKLPGAINKVEWTRINPEDGYLDFWSMGPDMLSNRFLNGAVIHNNTVYLVGGRNSVILTGVEKIKLIEGNEKQIKKLKWREDTPLETPRDALSLLLVKDNIYAIGGNSFKGLLASVEWTSIRPDKNLGYWSDYPEELTGSPISADAISHFTLGDHFKKSGQTDFAIMEFKELVRLAPHSAEGYNLLGEAYLEKKEYKNAKTAFGEALKRETGYLLARFNLGISYYNLKRYESAIKEYIEVVRQKPDYVPARRNLATTFLDLNRFSKAIPHYEYILKIDPNDTMVKGFLQYAREKAKNE